MTHSSISDDRHCGMTFVNEEHVVLEQYRRLESAATMPQSGDQSAPRIIPMKIQPLIAWGNCPMALVPSGLRLNGWGYG